MTLIRAILFDKDGTLLDFNRTWLPRYREAVRWIATRISGQLTEHDLLAVGGYIAGRETWQSDSVLATGSNVQIIESWENLIGRRFNEDEHQRIAGFFRPDRVTYIPVVEPIRPCLEALYNRGFFLGIATMDDELQASQAVKGLGIDSLFCFICGADSGYGVKPEPGMLWAFASELGLAPQEVAVVGDSPRDIHMGINAGAGLNIGVLTGAHDAEQLLPHTSHVLPNLTALEDFLDNT